MTDVVRLELAAAIEPIDGCYAAPDEGGTSMVWLRNSAALLFAARGALIVTSKSEKHAVAAGEALLYATAEVERLAVAFEGDCEW